MAERLNAPVLKTVSGETRSGVRIPLPPPINKEPGAIRARPQKPARIAPEQIWCKSSG
jgi:hypothetical protein